MHRSPPCARWWQAVEEIALSAMMDYLAVYLTLVAEAESQDASVVARIRQGHVEYCKYR